MKKQLLIAAACLVGAVAGHGQGFVNFENYGPGLNAPVTYDNNPYYAPNGKAGLTVGGTFRAELAYGIGTITDPLSLTFLPSSIATFTPGTVDGGPLSTGACYWIFGKVTLPDVTPATSGAVTFAVVVWDTRYGATFAQSDLFGSSSLFTQAVATGNQPVPTFAGHLEPFTVGFYAIPEPGSLALGGLGAAALLLFRRRK